MDDLLNKIGKLNNTSVANSHIVLQRVLITVCDMLKDRGYMVTNECRTFGHIYNKMQDAQPVVTGVSAAGDVVVFFHNEERVGVKQLRSWYESMSDKTIIIISLDGPTAFTKREAENMYNNVQFFQFRNLCVNIVRHKLVPKHERMTKEQVQQLPYNVASENQWPKLYKTDPVAQYYNFKKGDLIRITRTIGCKEPMFYYRLVCDPPE